MNKNYIAPEALDDKHVASCPKCSAHFSDPESKITFYQGECPSCGQNPSVLTLGAKEVAQPTRLNTMGVHSSPLPTLGGYAQTPTLGGYPEPSGGVIYTPNVYPSYSNAIAKSISTKTKWPKSSYPAPKPKLVDSDGDTE